jgi:hypothetical protein
LGASFSFGDDTNEKFLCAYGVLGSFSGAKVSNSFRIKVDDVALPLTIQDIFDLEGRTVDEALSLVDLPETSTKPTDVCTVGAAYKAQNITTYAAGTIFDRNKDGVGKDNISKTTYAYQGPQDDLEDDFWGAYTGTEISDEALAAYWAMKYRSDDIDQRSTPKVVKPPAIPVASGNFQTTFSSPDPMDARLDVEWLAKVMTKEDRKQMLKLLVEIKAQEDSELVSKLNKNNETTISKGEQ